MYNCWVPVLRHLLHWQNPVFLSVYTFFAWKRMWETSGDGGLLHLECHMMDSVIHQCTKVQSWYSSIIATDKTIFMLEPIFNVNCLFSSSSLWNAKNRNIITSKIMEVCFLINYKQFWDIQGTLNDGRRASFHADWMQSTSHNDSGGLRWGWYVH
jgi:hypothetical protein